MTGVTPRKLPPVVTCAPEGTERTVMRASAAPSSMGPMVCGTPAFTATLEVQTRSPGADTCTRRMPESISTFAGVTPAGLPSTSICAPAGTELMLITREVGLERNLEFLVSRRMPCDGQALDVIEVARRLEGERALAGRHIDDARHARRCARRRRKSPPSRRRYPPRACRVV